MVIRGALETPDRRWRVEVVQEGSRHGYRIVHDGQVLHAFVGIGEVGYYLGREGVDMSELVEVPASPATAD